jgi:hypothetical protein
LYLESLGGWVLGIGNGNWELGLGSGLGLGSWVLGLGLGQRFYCRSWVLYQKWKCPDGNPHMVGQNWEGSRVTGQKWENAKIARKGPIPTEEFTCTVPYYFVLQSTSLEKYKIGGFHGTLASSRALSHYASSSPLRKPSTRRCRVRDCTSNGLAIRK